MIVKQDAYIGTKRESKAVPLFRDENDCVEFAGLGLEVKSPSVMVGDMYSFR